MRLSHHLLLSFLHERRKEVKICQRNVMNKFLSIRRRFSHFKVNLFRFPATLVIAFLRVVTNLAAKLLCFRVAHAARRKWFAREKLTTSWDEIFDKKNWIATRTSANEVQMALLSFLDGSPRIFQIAYAKSSRKRWKICVQESEMLMTMLTKEEK